MDELAVGNELDLYGNNADNPSGEEGAKHRWKWLLSDAQPQTIVRG